MARILVIEDDPTLAQLYTAGLKNGGYEVDHASNGEEGLLKISQGGYALILMDVMMPKKDGFTVLIESKNVQPIQPNGPIVMMTNLAGTEIRERAIQNGAVELLDKTTLDGLHLPEKINQWISPPQATP